MTNKDMKLIAKAQLISNLLDDDTYKMVMSETLERQDKVMRDPHSSTADLVDAHAIVRALAQIDNYTRSVLNAAIVEDRKK